MDAAAWLDELRRPGKIRHIGLTNFDQQRLEEILAAAVPVVSHQVQYSVLDRRPANGMAARRPRNGIGLLCYGALAGGFLSDRYVGREDPAAPLENRSLEKYRLMIDEFGGWDRFQDLLAALNGVAAHHRVGIGAVAIRWVLDQPGVSGVIVGARHARLLDQIRKACRLVLDDDDRAAVQRIQFGSTGPSGDTYGLERVKRGPHASIMRYTLARAADVEGQD